MGEKEGREEGRTDKRKERENKFGGKKQSTYICRLPPNFLLNAGGCRGCVDSPLHSTPVPLNCVTPLLDRKPRLQAQ